MAAIALSRTTTSRLSLSSLLAARPLLLLPSSLALPSTSLFPAPLASLLDLLPGWLLATPKSKTTHSGKAMRHSNKGLKEQHGIVACPSCGTPKRAHHLCQTCHSDFRKNYHKAAKDKLAQEKEEPQLA